MKNLLPLILSFLIIAVCVYAGAVEEEFPEYTYEEISEDVYEEMPEDLQEEIHLTTPGEYDENLISISGINYYEYDRKTVEYHDRVAVCSAPVEIEVKTDLSMFNVTPIIEANGVFTLDESAVDFESMVFDESYNGYISPASKGKKITLTEPGLYNIFAETGYMKDWTELVIEIVGEKAPAADTAAPVQGGSYNALYTASKVMVDGNQVEFEAYNIADNNYFKLRDIAFVLSGTSKQFEVSWDEANKRVNMMSKIPYTAVGGELATGDGASKTATDGTSNIGKDDAPVTLKAYLINGNNYFKLRDLGKLFDFDVSWDGANNCILIDSANSYTED